jgi:hypothetical protein
MKTFATGHRQVITSTRIGPSGWAEMAKASKKKKTKPRTDGRRAALFYMKPDIIDAVKDAAAANDQKAWQFVEQAVLKALKTKKA